MKRDSPLSIRARWSIVLVAVLIHPLLLYYLLPVLGEPSNFISVLAPLLAAVLLEWKVGIAATVMNVLVSAVVFDTLTHMSAREGIPKAAIFGSVISLMCFGADRLRGYIERRKDLEQELRQAKKMEAVGRLAGGVAHDINNTLNSIVASVFAHRQELTNLELSSLGRDFPDLENITAACDRGAQLIRNLLGFARKTTYRQQVMALGEVIEAVHALLKRTANKNIHIVVRHHADDPAILGDRAQIESAVMNLCINAIDAMPNGGTLTLSTGKEGDRVFLCVEDTGIGMDNNVKERVFEPFFTTKAEGKGTGLGLSMVYGAVHAMSGRIVLDTAPGKGTSIKLLFPRTNAAPQPALYKTPLPVSTSSASLVGRSVLLIDDEPLVLRSGVRMLRALGFEVLSAGTGVEGVAMASGRDGAVDLVIVDFIMPGMDGVAVIEEIRQINPAVPVILASGFARESDRLETVRKRYQRVGFLAKPYRSDELVSTARELLCLEPRASVAPAQNG